MIVNTFINLHPYLLFKHQKIILQHENMTIIVKIKSTHQGKCRGDSAHEQAVPRWVSLLQSFAHGYRAAEACLGYHYLLQGLPLEQPHQVSFPNKAVDSGDPTHQQPKNPVQTYLVFGAIQLIQAARYEFKPMLLVSVKLIPFSCCLSFSTPDPFSISCCHPYLYRGPVFVSRSISKMFSYNCDPQIWFQVKITKFM